MIYHICTHTYCYDRWERWRHGMWRCRCQLVQPAGPSPLLQRWLFCWRFSRNSRRARVYRQLQPKHFDAMHPGERFLASLRNRTSIVKSTSSRLWSQLQVASTNVANWNRTWCIWYQGVIKSGTGIFRPALEKIVNIDAEIAISRYVESNDITDYRATSLFALLENVLSPLVYGRQLPT